MQERRAGHSGLSVSPVGLGTMTWGRDTDPEDSKGLLTSYLEVGGNFLDTASSYGDGAAQEVLGSLLGEVVERSELTICSKSGVHAGSDGYLVNTGRGGMLSDLDATLNRLGTDYLDLWLVQVPDPATPLQETLSAFQVAVSSGRARYVGVSNFPGWATARFASLGSSTGLPVTMVQAEYSLLQRGVEREVLPACAELGLGFTAWAGLGRGVLTGKYRRARPADSRASSPHLRGFVEPYLTDEATAVVQAVATAATGLGRTPAEVALAWVRDAVGVSCALIGPRTPAQLAEVTDVVTGDFELPEQIRDVLDEVTAPALGYPERP